MRFSFFLTSFLLLVVLPTISAQSTWESSFSKTDHDFRDYSIATAADGSGDMVVAGTLHNKLTDEHRIHVLKLDGDDASVVFELVYTAAGDSWAKSITAFQNGSSTGYAITGYVDDGGVNRTTVLTLDENGVLLHETMLAQLSATTNGMGLHIAATPDALNDGFVVVGMVHEPLSSTDLRSPDKQAFCVKLDQNLGVVWEKYFDSNVGPLYSLDWDVANFVTPTDQGYFITGGKNSLTVLGQQRQGILALMLDGLGNQLWDASYFTGNAIDMGASAWYDQSSQKVYVLANISVSHHLGISVFDAATGVLDLSQSFESFSSNSELDKYGHTLVKSPYADHVTIQGRALDYSWSSGSNQGQIGFLVNYNFTTQSFGVHYLETNNSTALNSIGTYDPLIPEAISAWYYPQALVNLDALSGAMLSYWGDTGNDVGLLVRKFRHSSPDTYEFCEEGNSILLDVVNPVVGEAGVNLTATNASSTIGSPNLLDAPEATFFDTICLRPLQCCEDEMTFNDAVNDFTIQVNGAMTTIGNLSLTDCDELSIDWGDGHIDQVNASVLPISHQYAGSGQYPICIDVMEIAADGSACFSDRFCEAVTETSLVQLTSDVNVFPNPTGGATAVKWEEAGEFTKVVLLDVNGRILLQQALNASDFTLQIDMSRFSSGIYLLQLTTRNGQLVSKRLVRQ